MELTGGHGNVLPVPDGHGTLVVTAGFSRLSRIAPVLTPDEPLVEVHVPFRGVSGADPNRKAQQRFIRRKYRPNVVCCRVPRGRPRSLQWRTLCLARDP